MDKYEIAVLAEDYERKRIRFEALGMCNVAGLKLEERIASAVEYHVAEAETMEAFRLLEQAKVKAP